MTLEKYLEEYIGIYVKMIGKEEEYYKMQFNNDDKFKMFRKEYEFDLINKQLRPKFIACNDF
jgi:hypothetical protein